MSQGTSLFTRGWTTLVNTGKDLFFRGWYAEDEGIPAVARGGSNAAMNKKRMKAAMLEREELEMTGLAMVVVEVLNEIA